MLALIKNGEVAKYPYTHNDLCADNPNISFPLDLTGVDLSEFGVTIVEIDPHPLYDRLTHDVESLPPALIDGQWRVEQTVVLLPEAEAKARVRDYRDQLIGSTDWMALPDSPHCTPELLAYRQALRDVPQQAGFPYQVDWPPIVSIATPAANAAGEP